MGLRLLICWSWIIPLKPMESQVSLNVEGRQKTQCEKKWCEKDSTVTISFEGQGRGPWVTQCKCHLWNSDLHYLKDNKILLLLVKDTKVVVIFYISKRKLIQASKRSTYCHLLTWLKCLWWRRLILRSNILRKSYPRHPCRSSEVSKCHFSCVLLVK